MTTVYCATSINLWRLLIPGGPEISTQISIEIFSWTTWCYCTRFLARVYILLPIIFPNFEKTVSQCIWIWHFKEDSSFLFYKIDVEIILDLFFTVLLFPIIVVFSQSSLIHPFFSGRILHYVIFIFVEK